MVAFSAREEAPLVWAGHTQALIVSWLLYGRLGLFTASGIIMCLSRSYRQLVHKTASGKCGMGNRGQGWREGRPFESSG